jgi:hypothetical protein
VPENDAVKHTGSQSPGVTETVRFGSTTGGFGPVGPVGVGGAGGVYWPVKTAAVSTSPPVTFSVHGFPWPAQAPSQPAKAWPIVTYAVSFTSRFWSNGLMHAIGQSIR